MVSMRFEGGAELAKALDQLSTRLQKRVVREVLSEGGELIQRTAERLVRVHPDAPHLKDNIGISAAQPTDGDIAAVKIGPVKGFAYGLPLEIGTRHHAAFPFMRPALDTNAQRALDVMAAAFWRELAGRGIGRTSTVPTIVETPGPML